MSHPSMTHYLINSIDTNISFTIKTECNRKIAFLDTLVSRRNGAIVVDVYRKPTHTDRYLDFNSHHDNRHKASTASTLLHRALSLPNSAEGKKRELNYVHAALESNGYPSKFIKNIHVKRSRKKEHLRNTKTAAKGSRIANHAWSNNHAIDFENASIIDKGTFRTRKTLEAWHTKVTPNADNNSCPLPAQYNILFNKHP